MWLYQGETPFKKKKKKKKKTKKKEKKKKIKAHKGLNINVKKTRQIACKSFDEHRLVLSKAKAVLHKNNTRT